MKNYALTPSLIEQFADAVALHAHLPARITAPGVSLIAALFFVASSHAANFTWDGGALLNSDWSQDNNWAGNNQPPSNGTADLFFLGTDRLDATADAQWNVRSLTFSNTAGAFNIQGSTLTIGAGGITNQDTGLQKISNNLVLSAAQTFDTTTSGGLDLFGTVNNGGNLLTVDASTGAVRLLDTIAGSGGLTKTGSGALTLGGGANTFGGGTTVNAGSLILSKAAGVTAIAGPLVVNGGGVTVTTNEQISNASAVTINGAGTLTLQNGVSETLGALTIGGGTAQMNTAALTANGVTMTGGTLVSTPGGIFTLSGNGVTNASAATATISPATLTLSNSPHAFDVADGAAAVDLTIGAAITGGTSINKTGAGTMRWGGAAANTFAGFVAVLAGTLELGKPAGVTAITSSLIIGNGSGAGTVRLLADNQIGSLGSVAISEGALDLNGFSETLDTPLTMDGGTINTGAGTLTLGGNLVTNVSGSVVPTINGNLSLGGAVRSFTVSDNAAVNDLIVNAAIANGGIAKSDLGTLLLAGPSANTFTGTMNVNSGELRLGKPAGVNAITGPLIVGTGSGTGKTARLLASEQIADTSTVTLNAGVLALNGFSETIGALTLIAGNVQDSTGLSVLTLGGDVTVGALGTSQCFARVDLGGSARTFNVADASGVPIEFNALGAIANGGIVKTGAGTLAFSGVNTYAGGLTVNAGEVAFTSATGAGTGTLTLNGGAIRANSVPRILANAVTLGGDFTIGGALDLTLSGPATLTGDRTINVTNTGLTTFSGAITEDVAGRTLTKAGLGTLTISGEQNYSALVVTSGAVNLNTSLGDGDSTVDVTPLSGTAFVNFNTNQTLASLTIGDGGVVTLNGTASAASLVAEGAAFENSALPAQGVPEPSGLSLVTAASLVIFSMRLRRSTAIR